MTTCGEEGEGGCVEGVLGGWVGDGSPALGGEGGLVKGEDVRENGGAERWED